MKKVYTCAICHAVIESLADCSCGDSCSFICCGQKMKECPANTVDASREKHVPVASAGAAGIKVSVGSVAHPMTAEHNIMWIEVVNGSYSNRKYLKPGDAPEAEFYVPKAPGLILRAYCNLHGLWQATVA